MLHAVRLVSLFAAVWAACYSSSIKAEISFEEVTSSAGLTYVGPSFGASWGDSNGDGHSDFWSGNHADDVLFVDPGLYNNNGNGTFIDDTASVQFRSDDMHGTAWADFDNDGDQDFLVLVGASSGQGSKPNQFFVNSGGLFQERAQEFGLDYPLGRGRTPLWFDWDNDGKLDVFLANWPRDDGQAPSALFTQAEGSFFDSFPNTGLDASSNNNFAQLIGMGSGFSPALTIEGNPYPDRVYDYRATPFVDLNGATGLFHAAIWSAKDTAVADFDGDLQHDLFMVRAKNGSEVTLLDPNTIAARVEFVASEQGFSVSGGGTLQVLVEPPSRIKPENIFIGSLAGNPSGRRIELSPTDPAVIGMPYHSPSVDFGLFIGYDASSDQWQFLASKDAWLGLNILITATDPVSSVAPIGFANSDGGLPDKLLVQNGAGFSDVSATAGVTAASPCEGVTAADFDNDMDVDLYLVCRGPATNRPNILYENLGGSFQAVANAGGAAGSTVGRGDAVASADYDGDGFVDLLVTNGRGDAPFNEGPSQLFRNLGNANHWLEIDLEGVKSNRDGIGAQMLVTAGGVTQYRMQDGGMHRFSQDDKRIHFGLAGNTVVDTLTVEWPSGIVQMLINIPADEVVQVLEPSYPALLSRPSYVEGQEAGLYLWKDSFDGPYHIEVNGDGPLSVFSVELIADQTLASVTPQLLEANDTLAWNANHLQFEGRVTSGIDKLDFQLAPGSRAMLAVEQNGVANPRQLHIGASGDPLTPAGWVLEADTLPALPAFQGGVDLGLFVGRASGEVRARWNGDGPNHRSELDLLFSQLPTAVTPVGYESNDVLETTPYSAAAEGVVGVWWDGLNVDLPAGTRMGLAYKQDGLVQPHWVNPASRNLGLPNAYRLPQATPYGAPAYDPATEANLNLWKDEVTGVWHVQATAGSGFARYTGELVSDQPFARVSANGLEASDTLNNTTAPTRIVFDLSMWSPWEDGFEFEVPAGASVQLSLQPQGSEDPAQTIRIGAQRWPVEQLPVNISGW